MPAHEADHILSKAKAKAMGWTQEQIDGSSNVQAISKNCHKRETQEEQGKTYRPKALIGLHGYPIKG